MTTKTATYKGREYTLLFLGETKFGKRAHLAFRDGSKSFWVEAKLVSEASASTSSPSSRRSSRDWPGKDCPCCGSEPLDNNLSCWECGYRGRG